MAKKKITVLGDVGDDLTPEEEHRIEAKIDKMLDPTQPDEVKPPADAQIAKANDKPLLDLPEELVDELAAEPDVEEAETTSTDTTDKEVEAAPVEPKKAVKIVPIDANDEVAEEPAGEETVTLPALDEAPSEEPVAKSAPPLPKAAKKTAIKIVDHTDEPAADQVPETKIIGHTGRTITPLTADDDQAEETVADASKPEVTEEVAESSEPRSEVEPIEEKAPKPAAEKPDVATESINKKYRPPDGPMPFKRAEPAATDEIIDDLTSKPDSSLDSEAAEISRAFDTKPARAKKPKSAASRPRLTIVWVLLVLIIGAAAAVLLVPSLRTMAFNLAGIRGSATISVVDAVTKQPLSEAQITAGTSRASTDSTGKATLSNLELGTQTVTIQKLAFAPTTKASVISRGTTDIGLVSLTATGKRYQLTVSDYLSAKAVTSARVSDGAATAQADKAGLATLTVPASAGATATVSAQGYQTQTVSLVTSLAAQKVVLVPSGNDIFLSRQGGIYNVYGVAADGQTKKLLLAGTGSENSQTVIVPSSDTSKAAVISTRSSQRGSSGDPVQTLTLVDVKTAAVTTIDQADKLKIVGWYGNRLVYVAAKLTTDTTDANRYQLQAYNVATKQKQLLDHANYFNDVLNANGLIYYATSSTSSPGQLFAIHPDASQKQTLLTSEVLSIFRTDYQKLLFVTAASRYSYSPGSKPQMTNDTYSGTGELYVDNQTGNYSAHVTGRGADASLLLYSKATGKEAKLVSAGAATYPLSWLNNTTLVYRKTAGNDPADYAVNVQTGDTKKITSVVDINGLTLWKH